VYLKPAFAAAHECDRVVRVLKLLLHRLHLEDVDVLVLPALVELRLSVESHLGLRGATTKSLALLETGSMEQRARVLQALAHLKWPLGRKLESLARCLQVGVDVHSGTASLLAHVLHEEGERHKG